MHLCPLPGDPALDFCGHPPALGIALRYLHMANSLFPQGGGPWASCFSNAFKLSHSPLVGPRKVHVLQMLRVNGYYVSWSLIHILIPRGVHWSP